MKAITLQAHGGIQALVLKTDAPTPKPGHGEVLVRVKATTVNRVDLVLRQGYPGLSLSLPHILGADIAGEVAEAGPDVPSFQPGDRVLAWPIIACGTCELCQQNRRWLCLNWKYFGMHVPGSYAEFVAVPAESLIHLPEKISFTVAAALPVAGLTAYHAITTVGKLAPGETALIWGGSGGLGTFAVQIAKARGARVIATVGKDAKRAKLESLGADLVLNHHSSDVPAEIESYTGGRGLELVLDSIGAHTFPVGFQLLKKGGRILLCGLMTGREAPLNLHMTYLKHLSILGLYLGEKSELQSLLELVANGKIVPVIDRTLRLEEAPQAHRAIDAGEHLGKIVLVP